MSPPPPAVIVTLPARTISEARRQIAEAKDAGADLAEIRLDRLPSSEMARLGTRFPSPLPLVATLRSAAEGGEGPDDGGSRNRILKDASRLPFRWIDVEGARDLPAAEAFSRPGVQTLIVSTHFAHGVSASEWAKCLREPTLPGSVRKVVAFATVGQLLRELIPELPPTGEAAAVAGSVGPSGSLLRAWARRFGFPFVYAALPARSDSSSAVEPSQIPVDFLRTYLDAEGSPPLFAIVGHPVAHSRSPVLHGRWIRDASKAGLFLALDFVSETEFADSLPSLADGGFRGLSVTHPYKAVAMELASRVGPGAAACGVANTLTMGSGEVEAENTDLVAMLQRLEELRASGVWDGRSLGVLGAGGAARATLAAARSLGIESYVWARRPEAADEIAQEFGAHSVRTPSAEGPSLVVHATPVGRAGTPDDVLPPLDWVRSGTHVVDWVYLPDHPIVRRSAERMGATYEDGSRLLVYQAASSFGIWWGNEPSADQVSRAVRELR